MTYKQQKQWQHNFGNDLQHWLCTDKIVVMGVHQGLLSLVLIAEKD